MINNPTIRGLQRGGDRTQAVIKKALDKVRREANQTANQYVYSEDDAYNTTFLWAVENNVLDLQEIRNKYRNFCKYGGRVRAPMFNSSKYEFSDLDAHMHDIVGISEEPEPDPDTDLTDLFLHVYDEAGANQLIDNLGIID
jgi:hypothetical protein